MQWYDRQGNRITILDFGRLREDRAYCAVANDGLPNGRVVSTVWLGLDHNWSRKGPPLIFETMVFPAPDDTLDWDRRRYSMEEEALAGHRAMVEKWSKKEV